MKISSLFLFALLCGCHEPTKSTDQPRYENNAVVSPLTDKQGPTIIAPHKLTVQREEWGCPDDYVGRYLTTESGWDNNGGMWSNGVNVDNYNSNPSSHAVWVCVKPELINQAMEAHRIHNEQAIRLPSRRN